MKPTAHDRQKCDRNRHLKKNNVSIQCTRHIIQVNVTVSIDFIIDFNKIDSSWRIMCTCSGKECVHELADVHP